MGASAGCLWPTHFGWDRALFGPVLDGEGRAFQLGAFIGLVSSLSAVAARERWMVAT